MQKQLTKKDIKEVVVEALKPFARAVQSDFLKVNKRFDKVDSRLDGVDNRLGGVESRLDGMDTRLGGVERELNEVKIDVGMVKLELHEVKTDVLWMKENSSALFTKLDRFISLYEEQRQEFIMLGAQFKRLEERVAKLEVHQQHG